MIHQNRPEAGDPRQRILVQLRTVAPEVRSKGHDCEKDQIPPDPDQRQDRTLPPTPA